MKIRNIIFIAFLLLFFSCTNSQKKDTLNIAVASNMQFAIKKISKKFTKKTGISCNLIFNSSGKITAQISEGAPYDVFISANIKYPEKLFKKGLTIKKPQIYAFGKLVLWSSKKEVKPTIKLLTESKIKHIAIANPKIAPFGVASVEMMKYYNIYNLVQEKLIFGESIAQTNQFIISKSAEIGLTSKSVVLSSEMKNNGNWLEIDNDSYSPIKQTVVIIKRNNNNLVNAKEFYNYLFTDEAKEILKDFGYNVNENDIAL